MIQAGFTPGAAHLGTNIDESTPGTACVSTLSKQMYEITMPQPDVGMNERLSQFKRVPPQLQGMNLTHVPTGGFPASQPSVIVGADPSGGVEYHTRLPPLFTLPFVGEKRVTIMPDAPLTSGASGSQLVYRQADGKTRNVHGATTVERTEKKARVAERKRKRYLNGLLAGAGIMDGPGANPNPNPNPNPSSNSVSAPAPAPTSAPAPNPDPYNINARAVLDPSIAPAPAKCKAAATTSQRRMQYALGACLGVVLIIVIVLAIVVGVRSSR
jgi:hypothetical protein